jgi:hypothetical protein
LNENEIVDGEGIGKKPVLRKANSTTIAQAACYLALWSK